MVVFLVAIPVSMFGPNPTGSNSEPRRTIATIIKKTYSGFSLIAFIRVCCNFLCNKACSVECLTVVFLSVPSLFKDSCCVSLLSKLEKVQCWFGVL